ncbi:MAG: hypothetical protein ACLQPD_26695 [Desulfomonilaceae bacterium]
MTKKATLHHFIFLATAVMALFAFTQAVADSNPGAVLGVDQFMQEVDRHKGPISIQGVVTAVVPDKRMMAVVDTEQFKQCGLLQCPSYLVLPVVWSGAMPALKDAVIIEGQIRESGGKLVFEANKIEKQALQVGGAK